MRNATSLNPGLRRIGTLRTRSAKEVGAANWTIDAGPVDRDFVDFDKYRDYLPALGVAKIRLMTGWAKSERKKGTMDVAWLDGIVDWCKAHGIEPILELSYGNPIYEGAGGAGLRDGIPNTPEGLAAWDRWVDFLGGHFKGRVREWAMWNEPDINPEANPPEAVAAFNVRSAKILRRHMPGCRLHGLSLAHNDPEFLASCIVPMGEDVRLFDTFVYHGYVRNPDFSYANVERQKAVLARLAPQAVLRQGENGCASEWLDRFALRYAPWSEVSQAKWNLRRMLGDLGHGVESGLFCFTDINYQPPTFPVFFCNRKGYLRLNASNDVIRVKRTYYAVQNAVSVFDASVVRAESPLAVCRDRTVSLYEYRTKGGSPLLVFWQHGPVHVKDNRKATFLGAGDLAVELDPNAAPGESFETRGIAIEWGGRKFENPVWVDLMTGWVYELPEDRQIVHSCGIDMVEIPSYDSPCILTERRAVDFDAFLVRCDRPTARYRCGESATFYVESSLSEGVAHVRLDNFGDRVVREFDVDLAAKRSFEVKGTRDVPGFLRLTVACGRHTALWGAAFSPERISAGAEKPADFEAFWRKAIADYDAKVQEDVRLERVDALSTNGFDVFELSLSGPCGKRLFGLLSEPKNLSDGPFPVVVTVPGAGPSDGIPLCVEKHIGLKMNVHRYRPSPGEAKRAEVHVALQRAEDGELAAQYPAKRPHYYLSGIAAGPEEFFYYDAILGARRAVRWLRRRPETMDGGFVYQGGSQGAGVGLALVALDGGFRRALFAVPALTAHLCHKIDGRMAGWPRLVSSQLDANVAAAERNSQYFDGVNFASMIHCPVRFVVGYVDVVAPPHAGYAAYNACPSPEKTMVDGVGLGHATSAAVRAANMRWLAAARSRCATE